MYLRFDRWADLINNLLSPGNDEVMAAGGGVVRGAAQRWWETVCRVGGLPRDESQSLSLNNLSFYA